MTVFNSVTARTEAAALIPEDVSRTIIQNVADGGSCVMQLARRLPNMSRAQQRMPVLSALPTAYFVNEAPAAGSAKQTTEVNWANKYLDAAEIAVIIPIPEAVVDDVDYDIWGEIQPLIVDAIGQTFDDAVLYGNAAPAAWPTDVVAAATSASNVVASGTGEDLYDDLLGTAGVVSKLEAEGYFVTGAIADMSMRSQFRALRDNNGVPIFTAAPQDPTRYAFDGAPCEFPRNGVIDKSKALVIAGDFNQLVYSFRQDITWKLLDQAVITDGSNNVLHNLAQEDMVAMRVVCRLAWQVPNPINWMQPTEGSRYPFALLTA